MQHNISKDSGTRGRWRRRFHDAALVIVGVFLAAASLKWAWPRLHALSPNLPEEMRFVDAFALLIALAFLMFTARAARQAVEAWTSHDPSERNGGG